MAPNAQAGFTYVSAAGNSYTSNSQGMILNVSPVDARGIELAGCAAVSTGSPLAVFRNLIDCLL